MKASEKLAVVDTSRAVGTVWLYIMYASMDHSEASNIQSLRARPGDTFIKSRPMNTNTPGIQATPFPHLLYF